MKKHGGPAFARCGSNYNDENGPTYSLSSTGMTLRQWYAGQALSGIRGDTSAAEIMAPPKLAKWCFEMADAMIAFEENEK